MNSNFFKTLFLLLLFFSSLQAQVVTTIVGTGIAGYTGDGGPASAAQLNHPRCIKFDRSGNKYIADQNNHVVRKINTSGIITTVAGNGFKAGMPTGGYMGDGAPATDAELSRPSDLAFDTAGNLYISDYGNNVIRKVNTYGIISTFAGVGAGGYSGDGGPQLPPCCLIR